MSDPRNTIPAASLAKRVQLVNVRQAAGSFEGQAPPVDALAAALEFGEPDVSLKEDTLSATIVLRVFGAIADDEAGSHGGTKAGPVVTIEARFVADYRVRGDAPDEEELRSFAQVNALYNIWPYWREFIQSSTARLDFPKLVLPVLRIVQGELRFGPDDVI